MEFFFENPFLVIVLIAVISSFFRKKKDNPESQGRTQTGAGRGQNNRSPSPFEEARDIFKELSRSLQEQPKPAPRRTIEKPIQPKRKTETTQGELEQYAASALNTAETIQNRNETITPPAELKQERTSKKELEVQEEQLIDAVIWAEILGPPRAKKPYMRKNVRS